VPLDRYQRVLRIPAARQAILLGVLIRMPLFAGGVVLTLHVVGTLGRSYGQAGVVTAAATVCLAISGPWRGRLLDRVGLRRVVMPSLVMTAACWSVAPFVSYWPLLVLAALAGLFVVPTFSIIRQAVIAAVPESDRRTALALDAVAVELSFMIGPVVGVWSATTWSTAWSLFGIEMAGVAGGILLWLVDPVLRSEQGSGPAGNASRRTWLTPGFVLVCAAAAAATTVLSGTDIAIIAALRGFHATALIGAILAVWGLGSVLGGLGYGALHRAIPAFVLLAGLSVATIPVAWAPTTWSLALLVFLAGVLCAPTLTATVDQASRIVPECSRGEAMGWHGSAMTAGSALGAPIAGVAIDHAGIPGGLLAVAAVGVAVAAAGYLGWGTAARPEAHRADDGAAEVTALSPTGGSPL
jgi:predicted MFS family arabinose efflux permease